MGVSLGIGVFLVGMYVGGRDEVGYIVGDAVGDLVICRADSVGRTVGNSVGLCVVGACVTGRLVGI